MRVGSESDLPLTRPAEDTLSTEAWAVMREQASVLVRSGFLPQGVNTPEKAISIVMKGRELGIPPMYALSNIAVINGKPTAGAELMLALIYRDHGDEAIKIVESTDQCCTVAYKRRGWPQPERYSFSIEEAERAGLLGKDNWSKYPAAMLRARCISAVARLAFPDSIGGLYTPEEVSPRLPIDEHIPPRQIIREQRRSGFSAEHVARPGPPPPAVPVAELQSSSSGGPSAAQATALRKLAALLDEEVDVEGLDASGAAALIVELSQRYNALDPAERRRRSRGH